MQIQRVRPIVVEPHSLSNRCADCDVRHHSVCSALDDTDLARLAAAATVLEVERGATFIADGTPATDFYNVTKGSVKLFKLLADGRQQIIGFADTGHFLGLAVSTIYSFSAEALEPVRLCRFSRPKLRRLLDDFPALERRLLDTACNELVAAQEQMVLLGRKTARERLASFLIARSLQTAPCGHAADRIHLPMTRADIADYLGLTIETVSRTFSLFRAAHRILTASHTEVLILDRPWLEAVAAGEEH